MPRRRLRLASYSDEEENEEQQNQQQQQQQQQYENEIHFHEEPTLNPQRPYPNPIAHEPVPISDDEFVDVSENLSPPSPASTHSFEQPRSVASPVSSGCPIGDFLLRMGLSLKTEWLDSCLSGLNIPVRDHDDVAAKAKLCFQNFLFSDMNSCGGGLLPPNVDSMHLVDLAGPFVLQVDEIVNISCPLKGRYQDAPSGVKRCLKLSMTDGVQRIFGMEYRPIKDLNVLAPVGFKVAICNVHIRHGLLMLVPEALEILGGMVEELEAAHQRLVAEVNKPPRGKRSRTAVVPSLATRASLAAWPLNGVNAPGSINSSSNDLGITNNSASVLQHSNGSVNVHGRTNNSVNALGCTDSSTLQGAMPFRADGRGANFVASVTDTSQRAAKEFAVPISAENTVPNPSSSIISDVEEMHIDAPPVSRENDVLNQYSDAISDPKDVHMVDEFEHPLILSGDREIPFTYLASLSAKWAAMKEKAPSVQGKVKCFLTGVKGFQYKQRAAYELRVYVDDGSLISEILIDHSVVQKGIGYSPEEVTAALSSADLKSVGDMKETLRKFQVFLVNFEGTMLVEMNGTSSLPVAFDMNQGCPASDAWLLMRRVRSIAPAQTPQHPSVDPPKHPSLDPIDISP